MIKAWVQQRSWITAPPLPQSGWVSTSQSCVVNPLFDLGPVHQHSEVVSEEQLARPRLETPPVVFYDWRAVLRSTRMHIIARQQIVIIIIIIIFKMLSPTCTLSFPRVWMTLRLICSRSIQSNGKASVNGACFWYVWCMVFSMCVDNESI